MKILVNIQVEIKLATITETGFRISIYQVRRAWIYKSAAISCWLFLINIDIKSQLLRVQCHIMI